MLRPLVPALRTQLKRTVTTSGGDIIATVYGTEWPVRLGRLDAPAPGPGRVPSADAPVPEIVAFMKQLGAKPGALDMRGACAPQCSAQHAAAACHIAGAAGRGRRAPLLRC